MAIRQHDRENLLDEARAYRRRILLTLRVSTDAGVEAVATRRDGALSELFAGQREGGGWSFYFDQETVLQLSPPPSAIAGPGCLRRLFWQNRKFAVERKQLIELVRDHVGGRVQLQRQPVTENQTSAILADCYRKIKEAMEWFESASTYKVVGQIPSDDSSLVVEVQHLLAQLHVGITLAE